MSAGRPINVRSWESGKRSVAIGKWRKSRRITSGRMSSVRLRTKVIKNFKFTNLSDWPCWQYDKRFNREKFISYLCVTVMDHLWSIGIGFTVNYDGYRARIDRTKTGRALDVPKKNAWERKAKLKYIKFYKLPVPNRFRISSANPPFRREWKW